VHTFSRI